MHFLRICLLFLVLSLGGCAFVGSLPPPQATWAQATGQIQASGGQTPIVGEIVIRYDDQNFLAEVTKGPSLPLLKIYAKGAHAEAVTLRGALVRGAWRGAPAKAPANLKAWAALPEVFHWARHHVSGDDSYRVSVPGIEYNARRMDGRMTYLELRSGGERIICRLQL